MCRADPCDSGRHSCTTWVSPKSEFYVTFERKRSYTTHTDEVCCYKINGTPSDENRRFHCTNKENIKIVHREDGKWGLCMRDTIYWLTHHLGAELKDHELPGCVSEAGLPMVLHM